MSQKRPKSVTRRPKDKRIFPPESGLRVRATLFVADDGLLQVAQPMIRQRRSAMKADAVQLLCDQLGMKKADAEPVAEKILGLFEWYGYQMFDK